MTFVRSPAMPNLTFERDWLRQPLNLTLAALRNLLYCFIPLWRRRAAVLAGVGLSHVSHEGALLFRLPFARHLFWSAEFGVSSYASVRSLLWRSPEISGAVVVRRFGLSRSVVKGRLT